MKDMEHLFIINPISGKGKAISYKDAIEEYFREKDEKFHIEVTNGVGDATRIVSDYVKKSKCKVYSIGGDGTLNEVLNGIVGSESAIGIIPAGSGNDFVRSYLKRKDYKEILKNTIEGNIVSVDLGQVNNKYFVNVASVGFDANVVNNAGILKKKRYISGSMAYFLSIIRTIIKFKSLNLQIEVNGERKLKDIFLVAIANGNYYGGGLNIAPNSKINDGILDIYIIKKTSIYRLIKYLIALVKGKDIRGYKETEYIKGNSIKIFSKNDIILNIDGELEKGKVMEISLIANGINLIVPTNLSYKFN